MRVDTMVRQVLKGCSSVMHAARLAAVTKVVEGIIRGERLVPATMGRHLPGSAAPKHGIKCVDRLLGSSNFGRDRLFVFLAIAHHLLRGCPRPVILLDWTHVADTQEALVAAVPIGGRALPIYIEVHPQKKLGNMAVQKRFLSCLKAILPESSGPPIIVTDAGFQGPFFQVVLELGWHFLGRVRGTTTALSPDGESISKDKFYARASAHAADLGCFELFARRRVPCRLVLVRKRRRPGPKRPPPRNKEEREMRQSALDPWLLATSVSDGDAAFIVGLYAKRMQIEETFRDAKNHRFGWSLGDVQLSTPRRTAALLVLATIAISVVTLIGMAAERLGAHRRYQANTETGRRVLSFFVLACIVLARADTRYISLPEFRVSLASVARAATA